MRDESQLNKHKQTKGVNLQVSHIYSAIPSTSSRPGFFFLISRTKLIAFVSVSYTTVQSKKYRIIVKFKNHYLGDCMLGISGGSILEPSLGPQ